MKTRLSVPAWMVMALTVMLLLASCAKEQEPTPEPAQPDEQVGESTAETEETTPSVEPDVPTTREVVVYISADRQIAEPIIAAFETQTGINALPRYDTEATKTTGLVARLRDEHAQGRPQADVFWSSEIFLTLELADEGILEPSAATLDFDPAWRDPEDRWFGFAARPRVLAYAPGRVGVDELPELWLDLAHPRFTERVAMADPRFGTTRGHIAALFAVYGESTATRLLQNIADNETQVVAGNSIAVRRVVEGEVDFAMTDADDVYAAQREGAQLDFVALRHTDLPGGGALVIPNTVARIKDGPNGDLADELIAFLLSEQVERMLAESDSHNIPTHPALVRMFSQYVIDDPLDVDFVDVAEQMDAALLSAGEILDLN
jgi:iron(III) transport system substrate-binding protein